MNSYYKGVTLMLLSAFFLSINALFVKMLDYPLYEKIFIRNILGVLIIMPLLKSYDYKLKIKQGKVLLLRSVLGLLGLITYYFAIENMILSDATMLNKLNVFFVMLFSVLFLGEKLKKYQLVSILIAFIGALFVIKPTFDLSILPAFIAVLSAMFAGAAYTTLRSLSGTVKPFVVVFYFSLFTSIVSFIVMITTGFTIPTWTDAGLLLLMGTSATIGQVMMTKAYKYAEASKLSIYNYSSIIFALVFTFFVLSEAPDIYSLAGGLLIIIAGYYNFRNVRKT